MVKIIKKALIAFVFVVFLSPTFTFATDDLYDAPGFDPNRETFSSMPNEHIVPLRVGSHSLLKTSGFQAMAVSIL
jgi:hypothetical protein